MNIITFNSCLLCIINIRYYAAYYEYYAWRLFENALHIFLTLNAITSTRRTPACRPTDLPEVPGFSLASAQQIYIRTCFRWKADDFLHSISTKQLFHVLSASSYRWIFEFQSAALISSTHRECRLQVYQRPHFSNTLTCLKPISVTRRMALEPLLKLGHTMLGFKEQHAAVHEA